MSEKLFKFFLSEVTRIRLVCQSKMCGGVAEVSLDLLRDGEITDACKFCGTKFFLLAKDSKNPLALLGDAMRYLEGRTDNLKVEIAMPVSDAE